MALARPALISLSCQRKAFAGRDKRKQLKDRNVVSDGLICFVYSQLVRDMQHQKVMLTFSTKTLCKFLSPKSCVISDQHELSILNHTNAVLSFRSDHVLSEPSFIMQLSLATLQQSKPNHHKPLNCISCH